MKISELIIQLCNMYLKMGDIDVVVYDKKFRNFHTPIINVIGTDNLETMPIVILDFGKIRKQYEKKKD